MFCELQTVQMHWEVINQESDYYENAIFEDVQVRIIKDVIQSFTYIHTNKPERHLANDIQSWNFMLKSKKWFKMALKRILYETKSEGEY